MSWQAYVDSSLVGTGNVDKAAIFNSAGTSVWATTSGFQITPDEMKEVVGAFKNADTVRASGLHIAKEKFFVLRADERSIYGKKGQTGVVIVKTQQAVLIAHYPEGVQPGAATTTVENLADYLIGVGY